MTPVVFITLVMLAKKGHLCCVNCLGMYNLSVNPPVGGFKPCLFLLSLASLFGGLSSEGLAVEEHF